MGPAHYDEDDGDWALIILDETLKEYSMDEYSFNPDQTSAEWILENVGGSLGQVNKVNFQDCTWNASDWSLQNINSNNDYSLYKFSINNVSPSAIGGDGESFSISH